ncbi:PrgI family protein [Candidatus Falkowbacteria bacterium]|jgi:hypothetical protein|nr:PrgI family protein [Candidatus Falkowbacteria bacterium]MBT7007306.1 PrgI family protein [Candidatus Falkowbacteria bacterium]
MEQFPVPQFIDVEDTIMGPITVRQFVLLLVGALIAFVFYRLFTFVVFLGTGLLDIGIVATLAFAKINGRPIHFFFLNLLQTVRRPNVRVWNRNVCVDQMTFVKDKKEEIIEKPKVKKRLVTGSRLDDLSLVVNTGGVYKED